VCERRRIRDVVDRDDVHARVAPQVSEDETSDASEAVDSDLDGHAFPSAWQC